MIELRVSNVVRFMEGVGEEEEDWSVPGDGGRIGRWGGGCALLFVLWVKA